MGRLTTRADWVGQMECLTVRSEGPQTDQFADARARVARLIVRARPLADAQADDFPGLARAGEVATLARELAATPPAAAGQRLDGDWPDQLAGYLQALRGAACAVYYCRRVQHPAGCCWFSTAGPATDVCGRVLALIHCLQAPTA